MTIFENPPRDQWRTLIQRPQLELGFLESSVRNVLNRVKKSGDNALIELTEQFDKVKLTSVEVTKKEIELQASSLPEILRKSIDQAAENIARFHEAQRRSSMEVETFPGVKCWRKPVAIDHVGIYIPGGSAPLFSTVLMLAIPAKLAGCKQVVLCTPPDKRGNIHPAILYAAQITGVTRVFKVGGAQAIAAMAYGTETIPQVYKIFGPGNQYVTKAKQLVMEEGIAIDMPAGPSEVLVCADENATSEFIAADLLSQAEHGEDSQVMLVMLSNKKLQEIQNALQSQLDQLPRKAIAEKALQNSRAVTFNKLDDAVSFINAYAPEHLIINTKTPEVIADQITNAGSVFLGDLTPEALGDYASGTNHTLPTNGYAKAYAGVSLESFIKYITYQQVTANGLRKLGPVVEEMAKAEELIGHQMAIRVRLNNLNLEAS